MLPTGSGYDDNMQIKCDTIQWETSFVDITFCINGGEFDENLRYVFFFFSEVASNAELFKFC